MKIYFSVNIISWLRILLYDFDKIMKKKKKQNVEAVGLLINVFLNKTFFFILF